MLGEVTDLAGGEILDGKRALACRERRRDRCAYAGFIAFARLELIDDKLDEMAFVAVQGIDVIELLNFAVYADLRIAFLSVLLEELTVVTLAPADERREQDAFASLIFFHYEIDDLRVGVAYHLLAGGRRICG